MNTVETKQCKKCREQINKKAKKCPHCGAKQGMPIWLIIVIIFVIIGIISNLGNSSNSSTADDNNSATTKDNNSSNTTQEIEYIKVTKDDLDEALENNAAAAKETYNNKYIEVTGKFGNIDSDLKYISLYSSTKEYDFNGIHCTLKNNDQRNIAKSLTKDQEITVKGKVTDVSEVLGYYLNITEIIPN